MSDATVSSFEMINVYVRVRPRLETLEHIKDTSTLNHNPDCLTIKNEKEIFMNPNIHCKCPNCSKTGNLVSSITEATMGSSFKDPKQKEFEFDMIFPPTSLTRRHLYQNFT